MHAAGPSPDSPKPDSRSYSPGRGDARKRPHRSVMLMHGAMTAGNAPMSHGEGFSSLGEKEGVMYPAMGKIQNIFEAHKAKTSGEDTP